MKTKTNNKSNNHPSARGRLFSISPPWEGAKEKLYLITPLPEGAGGRQLCLI